MSEREVRRVVNRCPWKPIADDTDPRLTEFSVRRRPRARLIRQDRVETFRHGAAKSFHLVRKPFPRRSSPALLPVIGGLGPHAGTPEQEVACPGSRHGVRGPGTWCSRPRFLTRGRSAPMPDHSGSSGVKRLRPPICARTGSRFPQLLPTTPHEGRTRTKDATTRGGFGPPYARSRVVVPIAC
ncbi:MAG: hypothetical protein QOG10_4556 [Kribbellaceae bacterium]|nr:hypothetical protein [Kribbellaceae bacterium]